MLESSVNQYMLKNKECEATFKNLKQIPKLLILSLGREI